MSVLLSYMKVLLSGSTSSSSKAYFQPENGDSFYVQFNPEQLHITDSVNYNLTETKENEQSYIEFSGVVNPMMDISFFFDTSGGVNTGDSFSQTMKNLVGLGGGSSSGKETDVTELTKKFSELVQINPELHRPATVTFVWGSIQFVGFIKQVSTTYTMFSSKGMPIRAKVDAQIIGIPRGGSTRIPLESPDRTKSRVVSEDKSIWNMAAAEYDDISKWRLIAKANQVMDPFDIPVGSVLKVPALKE